MGRTIGGNDRKKPDRNRDMTEGLLRQRRNLLLTSLVVIFFYLGNIQITEINLLGTKVLLRNDAAVHVSLWVFFVYFLYRYTIYYFEEPLELMLVEYHDILDRLAGPKLKKLALKQNNQKLDPNVLQQVVCEREFSLDKSGNYKRVSCLRAETYGSRSSIRSDEQYSDVHVSAIYWSAYFTFHRVWTFLSLSVKDSRVSDYWFPFLLAAVSLAMGIVSLINRFL